MDLGARLLRAREMLLPGPVCWSPGHFNILFGAAAWWGGGLLLLTACAGLQNGGLDPVLNLTPLFLESALPGTPTSSGV